MRWATLRQIVPTGRINLSTPEVTILDLCDAPRFGGGLSNVATVIAELLKANKIDTRALGEQATHYPVAVSPRERRGGDCDSRWKVLINLDIEPDL